MQLVGNTKPKQAVMSGFAKSKAVGSRGELAVCKLLEQAEIPYERNTSPKEYSYWDIGLFDAGLFLEVKYDCKASVTGNLAFEFYNPKLNKPSGIGITKSHLWCMVLSKGSVYSIRTSDLRIFLDGKEPWKVIEKGGDDNASLKLYRRDDVLPLCRRLDVMNPPALKAYLEQELRCTSIANILSQSPQSSPQ